MLHLVRSGSVTVLGINGNVDTNAGSRTPTSPVAITIPLSIPKLVFVASKKSYLHTISLVKMIRSNYTPS
ncbi:MAG: hypothetical protein ACJ0QC_00340 [Flavobacteriales bacterium]